VQAADQIRRDTLKRVVSHRIEFKAVKPSVMQEISDLVPVIIEHLRFSGMGGKVKKSLNPHFHKYPAPCCPGLATTCSRVW
jgi:hypothetical protein